MGWWANVIQGTKSVFAQDLPWYISSCQPCPAPWYFLWSTNCAEDFIWCTTSKENSLKLFLCIWLFDHHALLFTCKPTWPYHVDKIQSKLLPKQEERLEYGVYFVVLVVAGFYLYSLKLWLSCKYLLSKVLLLTGFKQNFFRTPRIRRHFGRKKFGK